MPATLTHVFFAKKVLKNTDAAAAAVVLRNTDAFYLGAQGPDFLFFSVFKKAACALAFDMHKNGIKTFFRASAHYTARAKSAQKDVLFAYLAGFICHYTSDCAAHPYIYYKTGFSDAEGNTKGEYQSAHHFFEMILDCLLCKKYTGKTPAQMKLYRVFTCPKHKKAVIAKMYRRGARLAYGKKIRRGAFIGCMDNFTNFYRATNDKTGAKRFIISKAAGLVNKSGIAKGLIHIKDASAYYEFLNTSKKPWVLPWDNTAVSKSSFFELLSSASEKAIRLIASLYNALYNNGDIPLFLEELGDNSFLTGLDVSIKLEFKYMEPYKCEQESSL